MCVCAKQLLISSASQPPSSCSYATFALNKDHSPGYRTLITYFMDFAYSYFIALACVVEPNRPAAALRSLTSSSAPAFTARSLIKPAIGPYVSIFCSPWRCGVFIFLSSSLFIFYISKWLRRGCNIFLLFTEIYVSTVSMSGVRVCMCVCGELQLIGLQISADIWQVV